MKTMGISHLHENKVTAQLTSLTGGEALLSLDLKLKINFRYNLFHFSSELYKK